MRNSGLGPVRVAGGRDGFTLVESLLVLLILSLVAGIADPHIHRARVMRKTEIVVAELNALRTGILRYEEEHDAWPSEQRRGQIPPELVEYLPEEFDFRSPEVVLDYENWTGRGVGFSIGLTYVTSNGELGLAVLQMLGGNVWTDAQDKYTWVIEE